MMEIVTIQVLQKKGGRVFVWLFLMRVDGWGKRFTYYLLTIIKNLLTYYLNVSNLQHCRFLSPMENKFIPEPHSSNSCWVMWIKLQAPAKFRYKIIIFNLRLTHTSTRTHIQTHTHVCVCVYVCVYVLLCVKRAT